MAKEFKQGVTIYQKGGNRFGYDELKGACEFYLNNRKGR